MFDTLLVLKTTSTKGPFYVKNVHVSDSLIHQTFSLFL